MRVGDKYFCKKSKSLQYIGITKNNYYKIIYVGKICVTVYIKDNVEMTFDKRINFFSLYFYDYFYTKQEERQEKLEKICLKSEIK